MPMGPNLPILVAQTPQETPQTSPMEPAHQAQQRACGEGMEIQASLGFLQSQSSTSESNAELREHQTHVFEAQTS